MMAQDAAPRKIANSKSPRIRAFNNSFDSADVHVGDEVLFYEATSRRSSLRRRGPAKVLLLEESGATLSFQGQTSKMACHCVRRKVRASVEPEASCEDAFGDLCRPTPPMEAMGQPPNPALGSLALCKRPSPLFPGPLSPDLAPSGKRARFGMEGPQNDISPASPAPPHQSMPPCMATGDQGPLDSLDEVCAHTQGPPDLRTDYDDLSRRDPHDLCIQRGCARKDPKASLCARLRKTDEGESARGLSMKGSRTRQDVADSRELAVLGRPSDKRCRRADAYLNFARDKEFSKQHAQWWD